MSGRKPTPNILDDVLVPSVSTETPGGLYWIALDRLVDNPYQTRRADDLDHVWGLAQSIVGLKESLPKTLGLQQPPTARLVRVMGHQVEPADPFVYNSPRTIREMLSFDDVFVQLHFGHSRRQAFVLLARGRSAVFPQAPVEMDTRDATYERMPLFLAHATNGDMWRHAVTENAQRKDISAVEEAMALRRAMDEFGMTTEQAGKVFGWARSTAANKLRLLQLPEEAQAAVLDGSLSERHARELCRIADAPERVRKMLKGIKEKDWSIVQLKMNVDWEEKDLLQEVKRRQEFAIAREVLEAGWTPPGCDQPLPVDRVVEVESWKVKPFERSDGPAAPNLIDAGFCSVDCPCMVVTNVLWKGDKMIRCCEERAPGMVLGCIDGARHATMAMKLTHRLVNDPDAERAVREANSQRQREIDQRRVEEAAAAQRIRQEAMEAWAVGVGRLDLTELWNSLDFWRVVVKEIPAYRASKIFADAKDRNEAADVLLDDLFGVCKTWVAEANATVPTAQLAEAMLRRIAPPKRKGA